MSGLNRSLDRGVRSNKFSWEPKPCSSTSHYTDVHITSKHPNARPPVRRHTPIWATPYAQPGPTAAGTDRPDHTNTRPRHSGSKHRNTPPSSLTTLQ